MGAGRVPLEVAHNDIHLPRNNNVKSSPPMASRWDIGGEVPPRGGVGWFNAVTVG